MFKSLLGLNGDSGVCSLFIDTWPTSYSADLVTPGRVATGVPMFKSLLRLNGDSGVCFPNLAPWR